jgi:hypothetical protein
MIDSKELAGTRKPIEWRHEHIRDQEPSADNFRARKRYALLVVVVAHATQFIGTG